MPRTSLPLALLIWLITPGSEHRAFHDTAWTVCEATAGDDAWRCEEAWLKEGTVVNRGSTNVGL